MIKKEYKIKAKMWRWPGDGGWHFVNIDKKLSTDIRKAIPKGFVKVQAQIGETTWNTSLFPHKISASYLLSVKAQIRKKEGIFEGDEVIIKFKIL